MKGKLTANLGLKIVAVLFAAVLWLLVTNINDPSVSQKYVNIPVKIQNADVITSQGKVYEIMDGTDVIDVSVKAPRSIIDSINVDNIVAVADMNDLTNVNTINIKLSTNKYNSKLESITASTENIKLNIEEKQQLSLAIKATTSGTVESGFLIGDVTLDQNQVRISGPASVISKISKAEADVTVTGFTSDIGTEAEIKFYDSEDVEIPKSKITRNIDNVRVNVEILATKKIPMKFKHTGTPAAGYRLTGVIESTPSEIVVAGKSNLIGAYQAVELPETLLNVDGLKENLVTVFDIRSYLPENIELADSKGPTKVTVTVYIEKEASRTIMISESALSAVNVPAGYSASVSAYEEEFSIQISGLASELNNINASDVKGVVDVQKLIDNGTLSSLEEGFYDVPLELNLPQNVSLKQQITVRVTLKAGDEQTGTEQEQTQTPVQTQQ